jgi:hypothetical protein
MIEEIIVYHGPRSSEADAPSGWCSRFFPREWGIATGHRPDGGGMYKGERMIEVCIVR